MSVRTWEAHWRRWAWAFGAIAILFPLLRLWPLNGQFAVDWTNHNWLIAYSGEYLRHHGSPPIVLNTVSQSGVPFPVFYGSLFYPLMSVLSSWLNPGVAMRLVAVLLTWLQFHSVHRALVRVSVPRGIAWGIACLVIWAIYPLTNLYMRSAFTEYVATGLLTCILANWFVFIRSTDPGERFRIGLGISILFVLTAGTHPITALYSLPILVLLLFAAASDSERSKTFWRDLLRALALPLLVAVVVLAPWVYSLLKFQSKLTVANASAGGPWFYDGLDEISTRLFPIPHDPRVGDDIQATSTPYLAAQLNLPLLLLVAAFLVAAGWRNRREGFAAFKSAAVGLVACGAFLLLSLSPAVYDILPSSARMLQIAYRAITYQNLTILLAMFMMWAARPKSLAAALQTHRRGLTLVMAACLLTAFVGVTVQFAHATLIMSRTGRSSILQRRSERDRWIDMPRVFYGRYDYSTPSAYRAAASGGASDQRWFYPQLRDKFGILQVIGTSYEKPTWVATNVEAFPWNRLELDGVLVPQDELREADSRLALLVPAGAHRVAVRLVPDATWMFLRHLSFGALFLSIGVFSFLSVRSAWRQRSVDSRETVA